MLTKVRKYTTKLTTQEIKEILNAHEDPFYKFSFNNRYETSSVDDEFRIISMPASRRGMYRESHAGKMSNRNGRTEIEITSKIHKAGPIIISVLFVLFTAAILFSVFANENGLENLGSSKLILMIAFMLVFHVVFYLVFIQLFSWIAHKWIENTLQLEKDQ